MEVVRKALKVIFVAWISLAVMASGVSGMVLCIADDWHFAVEPAHQGRCDRAGNSAGRAHGEAALSVASAVMSGVGACVDVSLSSDTMSQPMSLVRHSLTVSDHLAKVFSAASVVAMIVVEIDMGPPLVHMTAPLRTSPALLAQRTIVLRI